jgi:glutaminyl-tRNA synthetase
MIEPSLSEARKEDYFQFVRMGYFCLDTESSADKIKFNRTVTLKDNWAKKK